MTDKNYGSEPINPILDNEGNGCLRGLTKREYFSAMAMQGILAYGWNVHEYKDLSNHATKAADALITALNTNQ